MCMLPELEQFAAMDDMADWGRESLEGSAMRCCDRYGINCEQGRDCPERGDGMKNIVHLRRVHELEPHVMPNNTTGSVFSDFATFWGDLGPAGIVVRILCIAIVVMFILWGGQELSMFDWSALFSVPWKN